MTPQDAKNWLESLKETIGRSEYESLWHYKQVIDEISQLIEIQIPKMAIKDDLSYSGFKCPNCYSNIIQTRSHKVYNTPCCIWCGQVLNFEEKETSIKTYNKLVRDNIPQIISQDGQKPCFSFLNDEDYKIELKKKLCEEVREYLDSENIEELADILEVIDALAVLNNSSLNKILKIKEEKAENKGKFEKKIFLESIK